ncbi:MAG: hypothetical protein CVV50_04570 [Spirochaetae bacterium HGW-Spirochaetae-6]|nr:MAG: hypothetical protein CVV50_04570 [Spirochaetae bacterium HGW-Spirochaetae-6]
MDYRCVGNIHLFNEPIKALEHIENTHNDIILLDLFMPKMNGLEVLDKINDYYKDRTLERPYIIICTGAEDHEHRKEAFQKGIMDYIIKPYTSDELLLRIERISEFKRMEEKIHFLEKAALRDVLTGLWNKRALEDELERIAHLSKRYHISYSILLLDMDQFKKYNDTYAHLAGDELLKTMGRLITKNIRKSDFAGRFGGEEFLLILPYTDSQGAEIMVRRMLCELVEMNIKHECNITHTCASFTAGIAVKEKEEDIIQVIKKADEALYFGKRNGFNVATFSDLLKKPSP